MIKSWAFSRKEPHHLVKAGEGVLSVRDVLVGDVEGGVSDGSLRGGNVSAKEGLSLGRELVQFKAGERVVVGGEGGF